MNAKDLALAKINAGPKMFGFYAYGISLGMDIRELAKIINTPQGRAISKICEGNIVNGEMGAFSALLAIKKLEGEGLFHDLSLYDIFALELTSEEAEDKISKVTINEEPAKTASEVTKLLFLEYYEKFIVDNPKVQLDLAKKSHTKTPPKDKKVPNNLGDMLYNISILGKIDECINFITSKDSEIWKKVTENTKEFKNADAWVKSIYLLLEYCSKYGNLVLTYYSFGPNGEYYAKDLKILALGAEEMRILGTILSSNKGVKSRTEEGTTFIKTIENAVIDRKTLMGLAPTEEDKIDYVLFCSDANYRELAIDKYEKVKHSVNILDVISKAPHFLSYLRTCSIPYTAFKVGSAKFRARDKYYDAVVNGLGLSASRDKENAIRGIENAVNYRTLLEWAYNNDILFYLPAGSKKFVGRYEESVITEEGEYIKLGDPDGNGLATFKCYMEEQIIPELMKNISYSRNSFVLGLTPFELTKTGTHSATSAFTLNGNMMPFTESLIIQMQNYLADFSKMYSFKFPEGDNPVKNSVGSYADAFYLYSLYVFGGKKGQRSLMAMFDENNNSLAKSFEVFEAEVDLNNDFEFELEELFKWCAPESSSYNPSSSLFYTTILGEFGKVLAKLVDKTMPDPNNPDRVVKVGKTTKVIDTPMTIENRLAYIGNLVLALGLAENRTALGKNANIFEHPELVDIPLITGGMFLVTTNIDSGEYFVEGYGDITPESLLVLEMVNSNLECAYKCIPDIENGIWVKDIDPEKLEALVRRATKKVTGEC